MSPLRRLLKSLQQMRCLLNQLCDTVLICRWPSIAWPLLTGKTGHYVAGWVPPANIGSKPRLPIHVTEGDSERNVIWLVIGYMRQQTLNAKLGSIERGR